MEQDIAAAAAVEDDDFGDIYADVELEASSAINTTAPQINSVLDVINDNDSDHIDEDDDDDDDSEDDLDIVLNTSDADGVDGCSVLRNNAVLRSNEEDDNVPADSAYYKVLKHDVMILCLFV